MDALSPVHDQMISLIELAFAWDLTRVVAIIERIRNVAWFSLVLALGACGSDGGDGPADQMNIGGASSTSDACPDVSGAWKVSEHCDASLVDLTLTVTERECALSFAAPFDQFSGTVDRSGQISLDGPQTCRGDATANAVSMVCTPGTCRVVLSR